MIVAQSHWLSATGNIVIAMVAGYTMVHLLFYTPT